MKLIRIPVSGAPWRRGLLLTSLVGSVLGAGSCAAPEGAQVAAAREADTATSAPVLDITRSLAITDLPTLEAVDAYGKPRFSFERVLGKVAASAGLGPSFGATQLYQRIFDTNNTRAGGFVPDGQHCDDQLDSNGKPVLGGFPLECPRQEGALANTAAHGPFCTEATCDPYTPIAITNRFDLAPANGQTCGQFRIVFGKGSAGVTPLAVAGNPDAFNRTLVILEAVMPNPDPDDGLAGCAPFIEAWAELSAICDPAQRAAKLDKIFFSGVAGFDPVLRFNHYTGAVDPHTLVQLSGQIRANQFMFDVNPPPVTGQPWQLREYNLDHACTGTGVHTQCHAVVKMVTPKVNPDSSLFDDNNQSPAALAFRDPYNPTGFISQVKSLAINDLNLINMNALDPRFNGAESTSSPVIFPGAPAFNDTNYDLVFSRTGGFAAEIQAELTRIGSKVGPLQLVRRAQTQSCAGCHELATSTAANFGGDKEGNAIGGGLTWPDDSLDNLGALAPGLAFPAFTQTSEQNLLPLSPGVTCDKACTAYPTTCQCAWQLSPALTNVFLPFRRDNMASFLKQTQDGTWDNDDPGSASKKMCGSPDN